LSIGKFIFKESGKFFLIAVSGLTVINAERDQMHFPFPGKSPDAAKELMEYFSFYEVHLNRKLSI